MAQVVENEDISPAIKNYSISNNNPNHSHQHQNFQQAMIEQGSSASSAASSPSIIKPNPSPNLPSAGHNKGPVGSATMPLVSHPPTITSAPCHQNQPYPAMSKARNSKIPPDKINLKLILVSGKTKEFLFSPSDSASDIARHVYEHWPEEWEAENVTRAEVLRLIYQGRFLHGNVTLGALALPLGRTTVMHLIPRDSLPEPHQQGDRKKRKEQNTGCCSASCSIL